MSGKELAGGLALGLALGAGGLFIYQTLTPAADCGGVCGEGTACEDSRCVIAELEDEGETAGETEGEDTGKTKRRGRRGKRRKGKGGEAEAGERAGPPLDDDSKVPRFDPNKAQTISMSDGSGRLSDSQVDRELAKLDKPFERCVLDANQRVDELGTGRVSMKFGVDGKGKVTGVNVSAPKNLKDAGIVPCVRKAVYGHKFPAFDGPVMKVSSSFTVD